MDFRIRVGDTKVTQEEIRAVTEVLRSGQISPGPKCREFEERFAWTHGAKYGVFVNSGTDALRIAVAALKEANGWKDGSEVICPATTFVATTNVVLQNNLTPKLADNALNGFNLDRMNHFDRCAPDTYKDCKAIMPVHLCGNRPDPTDLQKFAKAHNLRIIEDSCESMGVGPLFGDIACYSTYVCHILTTGVGGIAITNSKRLYDLMRSYANHGRDIAGIPGNSTRPIKSRFKYDRIGYSARATELQAVLGLHQLKTLRYNITRRQTIAMNLYSGLCQFWEDLDIPMVEDSNAFMMFPIIIKNEVSKVKRDTLCAYLEQKGIETRPLLPLLNQPCYKNAPWLKGHYPGAERYLNHGFYIGCHPGMSNADVDYVLRTFKVFFRKT